MKTTLAEALLIRKELKDKLGVLAGFKASALNETVMQRRQVNETVDDIVATVPKIDSKEITARYDATAKLMRRVDAAIQRANWETQVDLPDNADEIM